MSATLDGWNFADVWEVHARTLTAESALVHGTRTVSWAEFDRRANGVAAAMLAAGVAEGESVAQYLYNGPEYLESVFAAFKLGLPPVNTNYRYIDDELVYLWDNADTAAVVFHGCFSERIDGIRARVPAVELWLWVDDGSGPCPSWAVPYEVAAGDGTADHVRAPWGRSGDSLYLLYTGGTTGMPKGVMWRNDDLLMATNAGAPRKRQFPDAPDLDAVRTLCPTPGIRTLPACPLMHGTGAINAFTALTIGGSVVTLEGRRFDAEEFLDTVESQRVNNAAIVGDAFGRSIVAALDREPGRWDISSLKVVISSGVMWSQANKDGLLAHHPGMLLVDTLGSSEAVGMASSVSGRGRSAETATFTLGPSTKVIADDGSEVTPGEDRIGKIALRGRTPVGYYKDPAKSAETFVRIGDHTYSMPGDYARVAADGTLVLLGRGSVCINTGGEKVFPEEVEEALKEHHLVHDAVVVGVPDERFGHAVCAVVEPSDGATPTADELIGHVRTRLAAYKAPKAIAFTETIGRAANGKVDYRRWTGFAEVELSGTLA